MAYFVTRWNVVNGGLLQELSVAASSTTIDFDTSLGRSLVSILLSRNFPLDVLDGALQAFPDCLKHNPVAFLSADHFATPQTITQMMNRPLRVDFRPASCTECPYPWIFSDYVTVDGAKAILQIYPRGVLQTSNCLSSLCPLDFFLVSPFMIRQRNFSKAIWTKFKLMLVASACCEDMNNKHIHCGLTPIHVILKRTLSRPGVLDDVERAQHVLWLLLQLCRSDRWIFEKTTRDGLSPLHYALSHKCTKNQSGLVASRELIKLLLAAHPASAGRMTLGGRLPIHVAIENGWPCHDLLLSVHPEALDARDPVTGLVPFQVAASSVSSSSGWLLDVTFELLRANPVVHAGEWTSHVVSNQQGSSQEKFIGI